jgi:hypothetical protein
MSWQGNLKNTPPNNIQKPDAVSDINIGENRAFNVRRDTDKVKNVGIKLEDIDTTIFNYLNDYINPSVVIEGGNRIKVPVIYGSPEKWKSTQIDGVFKDYSGKLQLPLLMFKRDSFTKNESLMTLNRYLNFPVMTRYTEKNKYDKFSILTNAVAPVNNVFMITLPDHIKITYSFKVWTELVEQLNGVIEKINFSVEDYWGDKERYRFRVTAGDYSTPVEVEVGEDRMVRGEFSLTVMGYLLPDSYEDRKLTTQKLLTPRKIIVGSETTTNSVNTEYKSDSKIQAVLKDNFVMLDDEADKMRAPTPSGEFDKSQAITIDKIKNSYINLINAGVVTTNSVIWHDPPKNSTDYGEEGWMAYDGNYHYIYINGSWKRQPITNFVGF